MDTGDGATDAEVIELNDARSGCLEALRDLWGSLHELWGPSDVL